MKEAGEIIAERCADIIRVTAFSENIPTLPYAVYQITSQEPRLMKFGEIASVRASVEISIAAKSAAEARNLASRICAAMTSRTSDDHCATLTNTVPDQHDGNYYIDQYYKMTILK